MAKLNVTEKTTYFSGNSSVNFSGNSSVNFFRLQNFLDLSTLKSMIIIIF